MNIVSQCKGLLSLPQLFQQASRNTHILKRRFSLPKSKASSPYYRPITKKHIIYDYIKNTDDDPVPPVRVYLLDDIPSIGTRGIIVDVDEAFARTKLFLYHKAVFATPENIEFYSKRIEKTKNVPKYTSKSSHFFNSMLWNNKLSVIVNSVSSWTIDDHLIQAALDREGIPLPASEFILPQKSISGPDLEKQGKVFVAYFKLNHCEHCPVRFVLHHWGQDIKQTWKLEKQEPVFEEDRPILEMLDAIEAKPEL